MQRLLDNQSPGVQALVSALFSAVVFAALGFLTQMGGRRRMLAGSVTIALISAYVTHRQAQGKPVWPYTGAAVFSLAAIVPYTLALLAHRPPRGGEWVYVAVIFIPPLGMLFGVHWEKTKVQRNRSEQEGRA